MISLEGLFFPSRWVAFETCREGMKKGQGAAWEREGGGKGGWEEAGGCRPEPCPVAASPSHVPVCAGGVLAMGRVPPGEQSGVRVSAWSGGSRSPPVAVVAAGMEPCAPLPCAFLWDFGGTEAPNCHGVSPDSL